MITHAYLTHNRGQIPTRLTSLSRSESDGTTTEVYHLEFVDKGFFDKWITSPTIRPPGAGGNYTHTYGAGLIYEDWDAFQTKANTLVFYTDEEFNNHVYKVRIDHHHILTKWLEELSRQPKDFPGPGRPPRRWLQLSDYTQRGRRYA